MPETELRELAKMYERKGLSRETARKVAAGADRARRARPRTPTSSSASTPRTSPTRGTPRSRRWSSFTIGGAAAAARDHADPARRSGSGRRSSTVAVALAVAGFIQARLGFSPVGRAVARNVGGGLLAMARHLRRREPRRHARLTMRMFVARGAAGRGGRAPRRVPGGTPARPRVPLGAGRAAPRHAGVPRGRARPAARRPRGAARPRRARGVRAFAAAVAGGGAFPNAGRARVLWAGLDLDDARPDRAVADGDRCPGRGQPGRRTGRRAAVPPARHGRPARSSRRR